MIKTKSWNRVDSSYMYNKNRTAHHTDFVNVLEELKKEI